MSLIQHTPGCGGGGDEGVSRTEMKRWSGIHFVREGGENIQETKVVSWTTSTHLPLSG